MLELTRILPENSGDRAAQPADTLTLPFEQRKKSRFRATLDSGDECAVVLPRGSSLRDGDVLVGDAGKSVRVRAATETLSSVTTDDALLMARAAYHLGNRHVPLQIDAGQLRYQHDHVLDDMVREVGARVDTVQAPFQPESGAYGGQRHGHAHDHHH